MSATRKLYYALNPRMRLVVRRVLFLPIDFIDSILGRRPKLVPPKGKIFIGPGSFVEIGDKLLDDFVKLCDLKPNESILDIGCGIGRIARPLASYLNSEGNYKGFDIVAKGVDWCKRAFKDNTNFEFLHTPLKNDLYNLSTDSTADKFVFPYDNASFDFVFLTSVFTHMQEKEVEHYINEISRVLKKGGRCFCTFFLITDETEKYLNESANPFFKHRFENFYLHDKKVKDANIAYKIDVIKDWLGKAGLKVKQYHAGWWAGLNKEECVNYQDVLIFEKE